MHLTCASKSCVSARKYRHICRVDILQPTSFFSRVAHDMPFSSSAGRREEPEEALQELVVEVCHSLPNHPYHFSPSFAYSRSTPFCKVDGPVRCFVLGCPCTESGSRM